MRSVTSPANCPDCWPFAGPPVFCEKHRVSPEEKPPVVMQCRYCGGSEPSDDCAACGQSCQMVPYDGPRVAEEKPKATPMTARELLDALDARGTPYNDVEEKRLALITAYDAARDAEIVRLRELNRELCSSYNGQLAVGVKDQTRIRELEAQVAEKDAALEKMDAALAAHYWTVSADEPETATFGSPESALANNAEDVRLVLAWQEVRAALSSSRSEERK